ncbi:MAG: hypothetical protein KDH96_01275 [Candidatus Riesia sp.]|nr:hypothetical protein [Candidatus Riesia sp.]
MNSSQKVLSDIIVYNKYAKYRPDLKRRETYEEIVDRYIGMMLKKYTDEQTYSGWLEKSVMVDKDSLAEQIIKNSKYLYEMKVLPSMRAMQFAGPAIEKNNARIFNCSYLPVDDYRAFSEIMFLLLGGSGVGYSVQYHHVEKLPEIQKPSHTKKFLIGDSIEGWADAIRALMKSYFGISKYKPNFDFSDIRPKGSRLVTAGGKAPGPEPLRICLTKIEALLNEKRNGSRLSPIEVHDIICYIADAVLAGGIRRAALISLFSFDDVEMATCKHGAWWELNPQRGRSNNSAVIVRNRINKTDFEKFWKTIKDSNSGEPGIFLTNDSSRFGTNPCAEISLREFSFCVSGDTKLITRNGIEQIDSVVDKEVEIWNGEQWSKVKPYKTGESDRLHRVHFSDGSYLDATDDHKFLVKNRFEKEFHEVTTLQLQDELVKSEYALQIPRSNVEYQDGYTDSFAYEYGYVLGDGTVYKNMIYADLYGKDNLIKLDGDKYKPCLNYNGTQYTRISFNKQLDIDFTKELKYELGLPKKLFTWDRQSILKFIAGWADADGSQASKGIRIYGREDKIRDGQLLLTKCGINSSVNLMEKEGIETNLGIRKNAVWYLQITKTIDIPCQRLICNNEKEAKYKGKYQIVKRIDTLDGEHKSYCLTENNLHQCVFNNVLTKQCNLTEINAGTIESQEDFNERARVASFFGTLQAGFTDFHYLRSVWKTNTEKDSLIGVGITGIANGNIMDMDLVYPADIVKEENARVAELIGINPAARTTTVKPAGTTSSLLGVSSGIHAWHSKKYIRNIQCSVGDDLYIYFYVHHPELVKPMDYQPGSAVIGIPIEAPSSAITREEETATDFLDRVKRFNLEWVRTGHNKGPNYNNVSATCNIKDEEWEEVGEWMWINKDTYSGISVLPYDGGTYVDAPFQEVTEEEFERRVQLILENPIDLTRIVEDTDNTNLSGEIACSGGQCELILF